MSLGTIIEAGNTAAVYEWEDGKILKLFHQGYPKEAVENEFHNAMAIRDMNFAKPKAYEIISYEERDGIIYDRVDGEALLEWVMKTGDVQKCAVYMAELHKAILQNSISNVPNYKDFLKRHIPYKLLALDKKEEVLKMMEKLPDGNTLCHGDFHPGNILISGENTYVIDFMNICHGDFLYDIARTVFLVEYTPVPAEADNRDMILALRKQLIDIYLEQMNVTREMLKDYLSVIIISRKGECPNE